MSKTKLVSARDYFEEVVTPAFNLYFASAANFQTIYAMTTSLYHFHEWMWHYHKAQLQTTYGVTSAGGLWHNVVEQNVNEAGFIRDLNNASKHVELLPRGRNPPSTPMHHSANTVIMTSGWGQGSYGAGPYGGTSTVRMQAGRKNIPLDAIAKRVYKYWKKMLDQVDPPPKRARVKKEKQPVISLTTVSSPNANS
ncbi:Tol biopolymer transport system, periplasmic component-related protein [Mesorhizobium loti]|nr:Tol biopolymer transport system, periplasmic component-related protein [Mesorhizobium loti]